MFKKISFTDPSSRELVKLAVPVILSSLLQMAYNITDMFWVGRLGSNAVAAVGTASFFINLGWALSSFISMGCMIHISQSLGASEQKRSKHYANASLIMALVLGIMYMLALLLYAPKLIAFFNIDNDWVNIQASTYLKISGLGIIITFINLVFMSILNAHKKTKLSFRSVLYGNVVNLILDPLLILVLDWGVAGAAWATLFSRMISFSYFVYITHKEQLLELTFRSTSWQYYLEIIKVGIPSSMQRVLFTVISIIIGRIVASWGADAIAAQKIGIQIEAISFMVAGGINQSVSILVGQHYGAQRTQEICHTYHAALRLVTLLSFLTTTLFIAFPELLVRIFVDQASTIEVGKQYLIIVGISQIFMCYEMVTGASFNGQGLTRYSASISIIFTAIRIPLALWLSSTSLGISGVWWSIALSSMLKGIVSMILYHYKTRPLTV